MSWNEIVEMLLKVVLLILATGAIRSIYFTSALFADWVAWCETTSENATGPKWFFATLCSCPVCLTYWSGIVTALCLWPLAALGGWWVLPSWLLGGLSAGYVVNHFSEDPRKVRTRTSALAGVEDKFHDRPLNWMPQASELQAKTAQWQVQPVSTHDCETAIGQHNVVTGAGPVFLPPASSPLNPSVPVVDTLAGDRVVGYVQVTTTARQPADSPSSDLTDNHVVL